MASLLTETSIQVRTVKRAIGNPSLTWQNTYELTMGSPVTSYSSWDQIGDGLLELEQAVHHNQVEFIRIVFSTYVQETGYQPQQVYVYELPAATLGARSISGSEALSIDACLHVKKVTGYGRAGKLFYRGCLAEGDVATNTALQWQLTTLAATNLQNTVNTNYTALKATISQVGGAGSHMAMFYPNPQTGGVQYDRDVTQMQVRGVTINKANHRYFDRTP